MPRIHPTALIEPGVRLGRGTSVWDNVHIRKDAILGDECIVGEKTYIAYGVKIGHRCKINASVYICAAVTIEDGVMLSNGNFHIPALALALDACAIALAQASSLSVSRSQRFMSPSLTGLPLQLTRHGPAHSGFATVQKTLTALWAEIRQRANPGSLDYMPVSEALEDHACMALGVTEKLGELVERVRYLIAIELLVSAQAVDLRDMDLDLLGEGARRTFEQVRRLVPVLDEDRPLGPDIDRMQRAVAAGLLGTNNLSAAAAPLTS